MTHYVVAVHGFMRQGFNMRYLARELRQRGYHTLVPSLPTTFQGVAACSDLLARYLEDRLPREDRVVHFVGHSMGGLVVRHYLSGHLMEGLGRVVLMGTPNRGSSHGNLALRISPRLRRVFRALPDLAEPGLTIAPPLNVPPPQVGIVIGFKPDPIRGRLLRGENDGLVTAESVRGVEAADELRVACPHEWIHWRWDVAEAVDTFLKTGKFKPTKSAD